jgi:hypothetical protein
MPTVAAGSRFVCVADVGFLGMHAEAERRRAIARPHEVQAQQAKSGRGDKTPPRTEMRFSAHLCSRPFSNALKGSGLAQQAI